jgi:ribosomal protein L40E
MTIPRPKRTEPAHISMRDWTLCVLEERARAHLGDRMAAMEKAKAGRPPEPAAPRSAHKSGLPLPQLVPTLADQGIDKNIAKAAEPEGCRRCGSTALFLDEARPVPTFVCGECLATRPAQARETRRAQICAVPDGSIDPSRPSFLARVALHLRALFSTANDNPQPRRT